MTETPNIVAIAKRKVALDNFLRALDEAVMMLPPPGSAAPQHRGLEQAMGVNLANLISTARMLRMVLGE
jgi:hypothetical protein